MFDLYSRPPDAIVFVIAPNWEWFVNFCRVDCDPPLNPQDRRWRVVTSANRDRIGHGRYKRAGDEVLWLGAPDFSLLPLLHAIIPCGFTDCVDTQGRRTKL